MSITQRSYFNTARSPVYSRIRLEHVGSAACEPSFRCGPAIRNMYILHYVISGKGFYEVADKRYEVTAGEIFVIHPDDVVLYYSDPSDPWALCWLCFSGEGAEALMLHSGLHGSHVIRQHNENFPTVLFDCLDYAEGNDSTSQVMLESYVLRCIAGIEQSAKADTAPPIVARTAQQYVDLGKSYIQYYYAGHISISSVAEYVGLERSYFYRIFKQETGISPEEYLIGCRIQRAKELIRKGVNFKDIARSVGIGDVYYFSKVFKKQEGMTPSEYRKLIEQ